MPIDFKPRLSGENSIIMAGASVALVLGIYQATVGPVSDVHATDANDMNLAKAVRKAGWLSFAAVAALTLLAKDPNIMILGGAAIVAEELCYRHALISNPHTGAITTTPDAYTPASARAGMYVVGGSNTPATAG